MLRDVNINDFNRSLKIVSDLPGGLAIPDPAARAETVAWVRGEFERNRHITDAVRVPAAFYDGFKF